MLLQINKILRDIGWKSANNLFLNRWEFFTSIMWPWENLLSSETESATVAKLSIYRGLVLHDGAMTSDTKLMEYKYIQILIFTWICYISYSFGDVIISRCKKECQDQVRYTILFVDFLPTSKKKRKVLTSSCHALSEERSVLFSFQHVSLRCVPA